MRVLIVGGVFGRDGEYRRSINPTPEMTLAAGLCARGVEVETAAHTWVHSLRGFDLVHVHHLAKSVPGLAAARLFRHTPVVFTRHNEERTLPARRAASLWLMNRMADGVVALSHQEADRIRGKVRGRVTVVRNGIDGPPGPPADRRGRGAPWRLLYVGQLIERKGIEVLFDALAKITPEVPVTMRLVFHNDNRQRELEALAKDLSLAETVTFVGRRDALGLAEEYRDADLVVLPSLAGAESLPSVITESLLARVPVVASADAGIPEQVADSAILTVPGDSDGLATAIMATLSDYPAFLARVDQRSREVEQEYSIDSMVDGHLALYETLVACR